MYLVRTAIYKYIIISKYYVKLLYVFPQVLIYIFSNKHNILIVLNIIVPESWNQIIKYKKKKTNVLYFQLILARLLLSKYQVIIINLQTLMINILIVIKQIHLLYNYCTCSK